MVDESVKYVKFKPAVLCLNTMFVSFIQQVALVGAVYAKRTRTSLNSISEYVIKYLHMKLTQ